VRHFVKNLLEALADALLSQGGIASLIAALLAALAPVVTRGVSKRRKRRRSLSYEKLFNSELGLDPPDAGDVVTLHDRGHQPITDPSMVVLRIANTGDTEIEEGDYLRPLTFTFGGRTVKTVDVTEAHPPDLRDLVVPGLVADGNQVEVPRVHLNVDSRFKLLVLLSGDSADDTVDAHGYLKAGTILDARQARRRTSRVTWGFAALASLIAGALGVVLLLTFSSTAAKPDSVTCRSGELDVDGSSAFGATAGHASGLYETYCRDAKVRVTVSNSQFGLERLANAGPDRAGKLLALSDGPAPQPNGFDGQRVAIIPFTLVVNAALVKPEIGRLDLTRAQVRDIFDGRLTTWREVDRRLDPLPIVVVARTGSGSRAAFQRYVLGDGRNSRLQPGQTSTDCRRRDDGSPTGTVLCEQGTTAGLLQRVAEIPGAIGYADAPDVPRIGVGTLEARFEGREATLDGIRGGYPFWAVEYAYTRREAAPDSLARAFAGYLAGEDQAESLATAGYPPCVRYAQLCRTR
jgi:phosphate transport system substrate-binding protein